MRCEKLNVLFFSPNGTTKKSACGVANGMGLPSVEFDLTPFEARWNYMTLPETEAAIIAMPVYGGRLPGICREFFRGVKAQGSPAVVLVTYGNNTYGEALAELKNRAVEAGFRVIAAAAVPAEHCMNQVMAKGRPDQEDMEHLAAFGSRVRQLLDGHADIPEISLNGEYPYNYKIYDSRVVPVTGTGCIKCGKCAENCPVCAINPHKLEETDVIRCLLCMRCVNQCPTKARTLRDEKTLAHLELLQRMNSTKKEQSFFFGEV